MRKDQHPQNTDEMRSKGRDHRDDTAQRRPLQDGVDEFDGEYDEYADMEDDDVESAGRITATSTSGELRSSGAGPHFNRQHQKDQDQKAQAGLRNPTEHPRRREDTQD
jgi:hypothetical protein